MTEAFIFDAVRTPIGRYAGALSGVRADDLAAIPLRALAERNPGIDWAAIDDLILGCANQAGEDNRNVARMAALLAGLGDAGGVESMTRAPFVMPKAEAKFSRGNAVFDTTIGWRFVNRKLKAEYGIDSMPETAENVAQEFGVTRVDQDRFAAESQRRAAAAQASGRFDAEIVAVAVPQAKGEPLMVSIDEHPRATSVEALSKLRPIVRADGTVTAGNASGVNDGAAAVIVASGDAVRRYGLTPRARMLGVAVAGVAPRIMGIGPAPAAEKLLRRLGIGIGDIDLVELNEAFASQGLAVLRRLGLPDDADHVNPNGGAIALGHPLGCRARGWS